MKEFDQSTTVSKIRRTVKHYSLVSGVPFQVTKVLKFFCQTIAFSLE